MRGGAGMRREAAAGRGAGAGASAASMSASDVREALGLTTEATLSEMQGILKPYFWPALWLDRFLAFSCFFLLASSKLCNILAPLFFGYATDAVLAGRFPLQELCLFGALRFGVSLLEEGQRLVYLRVKEVAYREIAVRTFAHLLSLSHAYHTSRKLGVVLRASDRGISSASTIVDMLFLRLGPTILEMLVTCIVFAVAYGSPGAAGVLLLSFVAYFAATISLTGLRTAIRAKQNVADNDAAQLAMDSLGAIETVKAWSAEAREVARYGAAVGEQQRLNRSSQSALVGLNLTQQFIMRGAVVGVLLVAARDVLAGRSTVGDFAAIQVYVVQLFQPLMWLGTLYTMISSAGSDMKNLADLLKEPATVVDAPGAPPLTLAPAGSSSSGSGSGSGAPRPPRIEFRSVCFSHGASEDRVLRQNEAVRRREAAAAAAAGAGGVGGGGLLGGASRALAWARGSRKYGELEEGDKGKAAGGGGSLPPPAPGSADAVALPVAAAGQAADYSQASKPSPQQPRAVLHRVSFSVPAGSTTAIVGTTGSGKSTISRLLLRLCDPTEGGVYIDGQRLDTVTQASVRGAVVGYVPQDIACVGFHKCQVWGRGDGSLFFSCAPRF